LGKGAEIELISKNTIYIPMLNFYIIFKGIFLFIKNPIKVLNIIIKIIKYSGSLNKIIKNFAMLGKGLIIAELITKNKIEHIHAHWASTSATCAYIASYITGVAWSFTCHRWDIADNNMLNEKAKTCKFIRTIDNQGYDEVIQLIDKDLKYKCYKIHVGVKIEEQEKCLTKKYIITKEKTNKFNIMVSANFVEKKGHIYLIDAIKLLDNEGYRVDCTFCGAGPLEEKLKGYVKSIELEDYINFKGLIPHEKVLELYKENKIDCVVLPSIVAENGEKEGIPVSLMEAMAHFVPVISTNTGGIEELLEGGAGIIVKQKNPREIADSIKYLINNYEVREELRIRAYKKVSKEFFISSVTSEMLELMKK
jgi:colanic acid/amylovoran biosynthesis glycosyltransferase